MKKVLLSVLGIFVIANMSYASITIEQARSEEQLLKGGYSKETAKMVQIKAGEYNPTPTNGWQKVGFKVWNYIDPASPKARDDVRHDIKFYPHMDDL